jgi:hypothetical protein
MLAPDSVRGYFVERYVQRTTELLPATIVELRFGKA